MRTVTALPLGRCVQVDNPYRRWGAPSQRRLLGPRMSTCGVALLQGHITTFRPSVLALSPCCGEHVMCPPKRYLCLWCVYRVSFPRVAWVQPRVAGGVGDGWVGGDGGVET